MKQVLHIARILTLTVFFFAIQSQTSKVHAQTCAPSRIINQYACTSGPSVCTQYSSKCSYSLTACTLGKVPSDCGPAQGSCIQVCDNFSLSGPPWCATTGSQTVGCSGAPSCQFNGSITTCSGGGSSNSTCMESAQNLTYGCWVNGSSGGSGPGNGSSGYGACGGCSGCPGTNQTQCRTNPSGACVWDPSGCGQGSNNPPPASLSLYVVDSYAAAQPAAAKSSVFVGDGFYTVAYPINDTCTSAFSFQALTGNTTPVSCYSGGYVYYNATSPHYWVCGFKATSPGIVQFKVNGFTTCPGYLVKGPDQYMQIQANPRPLPPVQCITPVPLDPASGVCAATPTTLTTIRWNWLAIPFANRYTVEIRDQNDNVVIAPITQTGTQMGCPAGGTCHIDLQLLPGTYHSLVTASSTSGACTPASTVGRSQDYTLSTCSSNVTMTLEEDPQLTNGTAPSRTGSGSTEQCTSPSTGRAFSGGGAIQAKGISNGLTYYGSVSGSTATINNVPNMNANYDITLSPLSNYYCTCPAGCTYSSKTVPLSPALKFYLSPVANSWYQTVGGDIAALAPSGNAVDDPIPTEFCAITGCDPNLSTRLTSGNANSLGALLINSGANADLKSNPSGSQDSNVGSPSRLIKVGTNPLIKDSYDYFYRLFSVGLSLGNDFGAGSNATKPCGGATCKDFYYQDTDLTINTPWNVGAADKIVVFVKGNLIINNSITLTKGGFIGFIVKGNISISKDVGTATLPFSAQTSGGQVQGMYFADGTLTVATSTIAGSEKKFIGEGTFAARSGISLPRDFRYGNNGVENNKGPASLFIYRPDLIQNAPDKLKTPSYIWKEVNP